MKRHDLTNFRIEHMKMVKTVLINVQTMTITPVFNAYCVQKNVRVICVNLC